MNQDSAQPQKPSRYYTALPFETPPFSGLSAVQTPATDKEAQGGWTLSWTAEGDDPDISYGLAWRGVYGPQYADVTGKTSYDLAASAVVPGGTVVTLSAERCISLQGQTVPVEAATASLWVGKPPVCLSDVQTSFPKASDTVKGLNPNDPKGEAEIQVSWRRTSAVAGASPGLIEDVALSFQWGKHSNTAGAPGKQAPDPLDYQSAEDAGAWVPGGTLDVTDKTEITVKFPLAWWGTRFVLRADFKVGDTELSETWTGGAVVDIDPDRYSLANEPVMYASSPPH